MTNQVTEEAVERLIEQTFPIDEMTFTRDRAMSLCSIAIAALKSPPVVSEGWQPIETAPKDGRWIIGLAKLGGAVPMRWGLSWNDQHWANGCVVYEPTHWQPLPEPPLAMSVKSEAAPVPWTEIMGTDPADEMARKLDEGQ